MLVRASGEVLDGGGSWRTLSGEDHPPAGMDAGWLAVEGAGGGPAVLLPSLREVEGLERLPGFLSLRDGVPRAVWMDVTPLGDGPGRWEEYLIRLAPRRAANELPPQVRDPLFDDWPDAALLLDGNARVMRVNAAAAAWCGRPAVELSGKLLRDLPPAPQLAVDRIVALVREGGPPLQEWHLPHGITVQVRHAELSGRPPRRLVLVRDVSALVRQETELLEQRQLADLGRLVAGVAHEVRNPLFAITATLANLGRELPKDAAAARHLPALQKQADRLSHLMEDLLQFSKPLALPAQPGEVRALLEELAGQVRRMARESGVDVTLRITGRLPPVLFDGKRLSEALMNLCANALSFLPAGGRLWIEARAVEGGVRMTVRDNGPGIPPELRERIFEPFFTTRQGGTGLGLAIVRRVLTAMGGRVEHRPDFVGGACFDLWLPEAPATH